MAQIFYDDAADLSLVQATKVAIIGYGSQGHAHALNLRDSGVEVRVGSASPAAARASAPRPRACESIPWPTPRRGPTPSWCWPLDTTQADIFDHDLQPNLKPGKTLMFRARLQHSLQDHRSSPGVDVSMVAPKAPGHRVREVFVEGGGTPALLAVEQDASGIAWRYALSYAKAHWRNPRGRVEDHLHGRNGD